MSSEEQAASDPVFVRHVPRELLEDLRSRVLHYVAEAKDFSAEIHQIAGKPPQLVLSLGGKSAETEDIASSTVEASHEKTTTILVQNIPQSLDEEVLELFFESKRKKGGGPVKHINLDREKNWAIIEFSEPEAVDTVLAKRPIKILDTAVDIQPYIPLLPGDKHLASLDIQGLPSALTEDLLAAQLDSIITPVTMIEENEQVDEISSAPDERVTETMSTIGALHLKYLQATDVPKTMKDKFPTLSFAIDAAQKKIVFDGHMSDIQAAKQDLTALVESVTIHRVDNVSTARLEIFQSKQAKEYISKMLRSVKLVAVWEVNAKALEVCCVDHSISLCTRIILESVKEKIFLTPAESFKLYLSDLWREKVADIDQRFKGLCSISTGKLSGSVVATSNVSNEIIETVKEFFKQYAIIEKTVITNIITPQMKQAASTIPSFLSRHFIKMSWRALSQSAQHNVSFERSPPTQYSINITGTKEGIKLLMRSMKDKGFF